MKMLPLLAALSLIACDGGSAPTEPTPEPTAAPVPAPTATPTPAPAPASFTMEVQQPPDDAPDAPQSTLTILVGDQQHKVGPFYGSCSEDAPAPEALQTYTCWWAGAGSLIQVRQGAAGLEVWMQETDEGMEEPAPWKLHWSQPAH